MGVRQLTRLIVVSLFPENLMPVRTKCANGHPFTEENTGLYKNKRYCRTCKRKGFKKWHRSPEVRAQRAVYWKKWKYGITQEQFDIQIAKQNGCCDLCGEPFTAERGKEPVIDHSHATNQNRGILHRTCNFAIGLLNDDPVVCRLAGAYLERYHGQHESK